ncbi:hypothetical protein CEUSTIGMA_g14097.t1, partial [Chlamydomonas eustigma]
ETADRGGLSTARGGAHQRSATNPALTPTASLKSCASSTSMQSGGAGANAHSSASTPTTSFGIFGRMESSSTGPSSSARKQLAGSSTAGCRFRNLNAYVHRLPGDCTVKAGVALMAEEGFLPYIWGGNDVTENDVMLVHTSAMRLSGLRSRATPKKLQYDDVE